MISQTALCFGDRGAGSGTNRSVRGPVEWVCLGIALNMEGHHNLLGSRINATQKCQFCQFSVEEAMERKGVACQRAQVVRVHVIKGVRTNQSEQSGPQSSTRSWVVGRGDSPRAPHFRLRFQRNHFGRHSSAKAATSHRTTHNGTHISNAHPADPRKA